jgi:hypothetical protein
MQILVKVPKFQPLSDRNFISQNQRLFFLFSRTEGATMVGRVAAHCCAAGHVLPLLPCARGSATCVSDAWLTRCHHLCEGLGRVVWCGIGLFFLSAFFLSRCSPLFCAPSPSCTQLTQPSSCAFVLCTRLIAVSTGGTSAAHGHRGLGSASDGAANTRMSQCVVTTVCAADTHTLSALEQISAGLGSRCVHPLTTHTHTVPHANVTLGPMQQRHAVLVR